MFFESQWHAINNKSEPPLIRGEKLADEHFLRDLWLIGEVHAALLKTPFAQRWEIYYFLYFFPFFLPERKRSVLNERKVREPVSGRQNCSHSMHSSMKHLLYAFILSLHSKNQFLKSVHGYIFVLKTLPIDKCMKFM